MILSLGGQTNEVLLADSYDGGILKGNYYCSRNLHMHILYIVLLFILVSVILKDKRSAWPSYVLQLLRHFAVHTVNKTSILRQRNLSKHLFAQISLSRN